MSYTSVRTWWDFARYMLCTGMVAGIIIGGIHALLGMSHGIPLFLFGCVCAGGWYAVVTNRWLTKP
jgi:hypothetical protein